MLMKFVRDESGLEMSEYAVAAALVIGTTIAAFSSLGNVIVAKIQALTDAINSLWKVQLM